MQVDNFVLSTPVGRLDISILDGRLRLIKLGSDQLLSNASSALGKKVTQQISNYFEQPDYHFDLPLMQSGTEYQTKVWKALRDIPSGTAVTYGELAKKIGSGARAIGNACRNNPLPIIVPCHRVVAANDIGGFSGAKKGLLLDIKRGLLQHEGLSI